MIAAWKWGAVPDYLVVVSVVAGFVSLIWQWKTDATRQGTERNRQARLDDLRTGWHAIAPLHALPGGFDDDDLVLPFANALRQLQLSGVSKVLDEANTVITTLDTQGAQGHDMNINLAPLLEAIRADYRSLMDIPPTTAPFAPLHIMSKAEAKRRLKK